MTILSPIFGVIVVANSTVCVLVVRSDFYSRGQKIAQCALVWLVPFVGSFGVWAFLRSQYKLGKYDTRAYPEHSEKMINVAISNESHDHLGHSAGHSGGD
jgi:hypothetical protein